MIFKSKIIYNIKELNRNEIVILIRYEHLCALFLLYNNINNDIKNAKIKYN